MLKLYATNRNLLHCRRNAMQHNMPAQIDLCGMLHLSTDDDTVYVNVAVEIHVLDHNIAIVCSVNGVLSSHQH